MRPLLLLCLPFVWLSLPAHAQEASAALTERLDRLERDLSFVQKQIYRNSGDAASSGGAPATPGNLQMRVSQIDEEIRQIRGLIEQTQFQNKQTATDLKKLSDDVDYRLRALEQKSAAAASAPSPVAEPTPTVAPSAVLEPAKLESGADEATGKEKDKPALTGKDFPDSNAHYTYAFKLLSEKKYTEAAASFDAFVKKYPADPLTANAYYWLGESQYARGDFTRSAESFRKGFETAPDGNKAPDNLYKLAMSLSQVHRKSEACIVLNRVIEKYSDSASRTTAKATEARSTLQCK